MKKFFFTNSEAFTIIHFVSKLLTVSRCVQEILQYFDKFFVQFYSFFLNVENVVKWKLQNLFLLHFGVLLKKDKTNLNFFDGGKVRESLEKSRIFR